MFVLILPLVWLSSFPRSFLSLEADSSEEYHFLSWSLSELQSMGEKRHRHVVTEMANKVAINFIIDRESTEKKINIFSMEKMERSSFGGGRETKLISGENPKKERETLSCSRILMRHVGILTNPYNPNLNTGFLFSFPFSYFFPLFFLNPV